jgi:ABC-type sugar transport system ATPase subunit
MTADTHPILDCRNVAKAFGGVQALRGVDFAIVPGRVHGLLGENGAGKSTLLKILAGVVLPDSGTITLDGAPYRPDGTVAALRHGVVTVHQDINLIDSLTVAENVLLNNEPKLPPFGLLRTREMRARTQKLLAAYGIDIDPGALVSTLPNDVKKMVQIVKATTWNPRVLLLDEPTSSLTDVEVTVVLRLIRTLAAQGVALVFVSHYLAEVFEVCDDITVLRDGAVVASGPRAETDLSQVVRGMLGRDLDHASLERTATANADVLLSVRNLSVSGRLRDISFDLHRGEILGVTGLTGSGLTELARAIFGSEDIHRTSGDFAIDGKPAALGTPHASLHAGLALLTNDRLREGILPEFSLLENICLPILSRFSGGMGLLNQRRMVETAEQCIKRLNVRAPGPRVMAKTLSGGNQQKLLFAKWLETGPRIFLLDEPTIGIDVGSKFEIRRIIQEIAAAGVGVILFSAELADIETLCDRVLVMFRGAVVGEFAGPDVTRAAILHASVSGQV